MITRPLVIPATVQQVARWHTLQSVRDSSVHHITWRLECAGHVDFDALDAAWQTVVNRHESLRSRFVARDGELDLVIPPAVDVTARLIEPVVLDVDQAAQEFQRVAAELHAQEFHLEVGPMARLALVRIGAQEELILTVHHIVVDGWGTMVLLNDLSAAYASLVRGEKPVFTNDAVSFHSYAEKLRSEAEQGRWRRSLDHWRTTLDGIVVTTVAYDREIGRPTTVGDPGKTVRYRFTAQADLGGAALAQELGATQFSVMLAAWQIVLARGGERELTIGVSSMNRNTRSEQALVGFLSNVCLVRAAVDDQASIGEVATAARDATWNLLSHQGVPLPVVHAALPEATRSRLTNVKLILNCLGSIGQDMTLGDIGLTMLQAPNRASRSDMIVSYWDGSDGILAEIEYNTEVYEEETVLRMMRDMDDVLVMAATDMDRPVGGVRVRTRSASAARYQRT
ncbi:condensation domain-containing protein [Micromonospora peucetia]|uniref:condensation domain-containing protein n=1 Tax=Micromonospora peucetia TaxID=47871 RepID=UPI00224DFF92|nr:condensation domain-containing protein [Micromonospora peucetia]MCX4390116.1 condensation domain-containing protein [Micromonospora peucetia]